MTVFKEYAEYYDRLYADKDYGAEARYVMDLVQRHRPGASAILDLGCGTGSHDVIFAENGCRVTGVDRSEESMAKARAKGEGRPALDLAFHAGEIESFRIEKRFDAVVSLFHVMSYLTTENGLRAAFATARHHLNPGGIFLFDCWYGPAVLTDPPQVRVKRVEDSEVEVTRIAEPEMRPNENIVHVNYQVMVRHKASGKMMQVQESHPMRYWFRPEVGRMLAGAGFSLLDCTAWMSARPPGLDTWNVCFVAAKQGGEEGP